MKLLIILFSVFVLFIFIEPAVEGVRNAGNLLGALSGTVSLVLGLHFNSFEIKTRGVVILLLSVFYLALFFAMYWVYVGGKSENGGYETVLVLGCRVKGSTPSKALEKRVDKAFTCLNQNPDAVAVLSGGQGRDEFLSEAQCMKNMLVQRGILEKDLFSKPAQPPPMKISATQQCLCARADFQIRRLLLHRNIIRKEQS